MKPILSIIVFIVFAAFPVSHADELANSEYIYNNQIDQMILFYQARLYLKDSEFKVLADIAVDAQKMITFFETKREELVMEMRHGRIDYRTARMRGFLLNKARHSQVGLGYTKPE